MLAFSAQVRGQDAQTNFPAIDYLTEGGGSAEPDQDAAGGVEGGAQAAGLPNLPQAVVRSIALQRQDSEVHTCGQHSRSPLHEIASMHAIYAVMSSHIAGLTSSREGSLRY